VDGPGTESRCRQDLEHPSIPLLETSQPPVQWAPELFLGVKAAKAWRWPPTPI
jgi:hypothetical protein